MENTQTLFELDGWYIDHLKKDDTFQVTYHGRFHGTHVNLIDALDSVEQLSRAFKQLYFMVADSDIVEAKFIFDLRSFGYDTAMKAVKYGSCDFEKDGIYVKLARWQMLSEKEKRAVVKHYKSKIEA